MIADRPNKCISRRAVWRASSLVHDEDALPENPLRPFSKHGVRQVAFAPKIFAEKVSSVAQRAELEAALDYAREGDALGH